MEYVQSSLLLIILGWLVLERRRTVQLKNKKSRQVLLDSCALIDGRIIELAKSGFVPDELVIPQFILAELQLLADGNDTHKRERARFGLDVVKQLQESNYCTLRIDRTALASVPAVDDKLVTLAKKLGAKLYTTDFNLNKVAAIEGVQVLNINELAQNLRPVALPGERKTVKVVQKGSSRGQGVGYLEDGTMIVINGGDKLVGRSVDVEINRTHQTVAGKMLFAQVIEQPTPRSARLQKFKLRRPAVR